MPQTRSVSWSLVVTSTIGMCLVLASRVIERVAWKPLRFGMTTSIRIRSGISRLAASTPAAPSSAVNASWPSFSTMRRIPINWEGESSTIRMRAIGFPCMPVDCSRRQALLQAVPAASGQSVTSVLPERAAGEHRREHFGNCPNRLRGCRCAPGARASSRWPDRCQISSRMSRAVPAEATPSSDTPRMMKGITVVSSACVAASPALATLP